MKLILVLSVCFLWSCFAEGDAINHKRQTEEEGWAERIEMLQLHNEKRAGEGHSRKLYMNKELMKAAQLHGEDMARQGYFSHTGKDGSSSTDRAKRAGYSGRALENIAAGNEDIAKTMNQWMTSSGHHRQIMSERNYELGIGRFNFPSSQYRWYWVGLFGVRDAECGNSFVDGDDACDDGNKKDGDGCSSSCQIESGFDCTFDDANPVSQCLKDGCTPKCSGKSCGDNSCGGTCGTCMASETCTDGVCADPSSPPSPSPTPSSPPPDACIKKCEGKNCGTDGCGGFCGICDADVDCIGGVCDTSDECTPQCSGKTCGNDGCGGVCGSCDEDVDCIGGVCSGGDSCTPKCSEKECGPDGCGSTCGSCSAGDNCVAGKCEAPPATTVPSPPPPAGCTPDCDGKECGSDSCGSTCGSCFSGTTCQSGKCVCKPRCNVDYRKECGADGCGSQCGVCGVGVNCEKSVCVTVRPSDGLPFPLGLVLQTNTGEWLHGTVPLVGSAGLRLRVLSSIGLIAIYAKVDGQPTESDYDHMGKQPLGSKETLLMIPPLKKRSEKQSTEINIGVFTVKGTAILKVDYWSPGNNIKANDNAQDGDSENNGGSDFPWLTLIICFFVIVVILVIVKIVMGRNKYPSYSAERW